MSIASAEGFVITWLLPFSLYDLLVLHNGLVSRAEVFSKVIYILVDYPLIYCVHFTLQFCYQLILLLSKPCILFVLKLYISYNRFHQSLLLVLRLHKKCLFVFLLLLITVPAVFVINETTEFCLSTIKFPNAYAI